MYNKNIMSNTTLHINNSVAGETIEKKVQRILNNKEPITDASPVIYTERKDGILPEYDIRTDKWDKAIDAMNKVAEQHVTNRDQAKGERTYDTMNPEQQSEFNKKYPKNKHNLKLLEAIKNKTQDGKASL